MQPGDRKRRHKGCEAHRQSVGKDVELIQENVTKQKKKKTQEGRRDECEILFFLKCESWRDDQRLLLQRKATPWWELGCHTFCFFI